MSSQNVFRENVPQAQGELPGRLNKPALHRSEASEYLRAVYGIEVSAQTLAKWASSGHSPPDAPRFFANAGRPLYPRAELDTFAERRLGELLSKSPRPRPADRTRLQCGGLSGN